MAAVDREIEEGIRQYSNPSRRNLDKKLYAVDERLHEWGAWSRSDKDSGPCSLAGLSFLGKVIEVGPDAAAHVVEGNEISPRIEMSKEIEEVEQVLLKLSGIRLKVVKVAYIWFPNHPPDVQRRRLNMSRHKWNAILRETRLLVAMGLGMEV